jgi:hypothetical protein
MSNKSKSIIIDSKEPSPSPGRRIKHLDLKSLGREEDQMTTSKASWKKKKSLPPLKKEKKNKYLDSLLQGARSSTILGMEDQCKRS